MAMHYQAVVLLLFHLHGNMFVNTSPVTSEQNLNPDWHNYVDTRKEIFKESPSCNIDPMEGNCVSYKTFAFVSQLGKATRISLNDSAKAIIQPISGPGHNILHTDIHYADNWIYWVEYNRGGTCNSWNGIYRIRPNGSELEPVIQDGIGRNGIRGIAVDWIAGNLYFTNVFPHETYLEVSRLDGSNRKVLVTTTRNCPRELAVNPLKGILYWIDQGDFPPTRIGKSLLDGSNSIPLVVSRITNPRDLTIDMLTHDVYWVDSGIGMIQKIDWRGGSRRVIRKELPNVLGIAVHISDMYWVDRNMQTIFKASKLAGNTSLSTKVRTNLTKLKDIAIFDIANQPKDDANPCGFDKDLCDQLCFSFPRDDLTNNPPHFTCGCATGGLQPHSSRRRCEYSYDEFLVFTTPTEIFAISLDPQEITKPFNPITNLSNVMGIDFDHADRKILFTQIRPSARISTMSAKSPSVDTITNVISNGINPQDIAYDWTQKKVYWTDPTNHSIYAINIDGSDLVTITRAQQRPRAIVIDPCHGILIYTVWGEVGTSGKIFRSTMAGSLKEVIVENDLVKPSGLAIDYDDNLLYWTDSVTQKIERSDLNGNNRIVLIKAHMNPFSITVSGNFIYWTDLLLKVVYRADKHTGGNRIEMIKPLQLRNRPHGIQVFSSARPACKVNPCRINNGGCAQSCHPGINGIISECKCNDYTKPVNEGRICVAKVAKNEDVVI